MFSIRISVALCALVAASPLALAQKKVLDASVYDSWKSLRSLMLSRDGKWAMYSLVPQEGDSVVEIKAVDGSKSYSIERGSNPQFSEDSTFVITLIVPKLEETKKARRAKAKPEDMPKNGLEILNLQTGQKTDLDKIQSVSLATHDYGYLLYKPEPPKAEPPKPAAPKPDAAKPEAGKAEEKKAGPKPDHRAGDLYILRNLANGKEEKLENVTTSRWSKDGTLLVLAFSNQDGTKDGVEQIDLKTGTHKTLFSGLGKYSKLALSDSTKDVALATDRDTYQDKKPSLAIYVIRARDGKTFKVDLGGLAKDFVASESGSFQFSAKGTRLTFATVPRPAEEKKDETPDDEKVSVDIWNWQDPQMMPQQLMQAAVDRSRTYDAIFDLPSGKVVQLETPNLRSVNVSAKGDGASALGTSSEPYQKENSWQETRVDYYLVDPGTGKAASLAKRFAGNLALSPTGRFVYGYDEEHRDFFVVELKSGKRVSVTNAVPSQLWDDETDTPSMPSAYGTAGWTADDAGLLIYDKFDIWLVDPTGGKAARCLTSQVGRSNSTRFRMLRLDPDQDWIDLTHPLLLSAQNDRTKAAGYFKLSNGRVEKLVMEDKMFPSIVKAKNADVYAFQRMDVDEYPDAWLAGPDLKDPHRISDTNPQQKDYNWCTVELVTWYTNDGIPVQGLLYKPENFDPAKKYPMIAYFYEKDSDRLHQYYMPAPSASTINITMYCSQGYIVFDPDIPYKVGYPGESAAASILPGVQSILARGYVDPKRVGIQGQSWGGYETGYLVTETNMFAAACAGAPVSNMVSAYGGIRWESGVSREGQYEHGQSRIGGSLWDEPLRFIENSPIFFVDKIKTPLLIMSNDKDGAVPWYQGIEYFSALRRLNKPAWLVCYNEEQHNLVQRKNRKDWSIRMQQFFDHYLKDAPMPVWMAQGIPATMKGKTMGYELVPGAEPKANGG